MTRRWTGYVRCERNGFAMCAITIRSGCICSATGIRRRRPDPVSGEEACAGGGWEEDEQRFMAEERPEEESEYQEIERLREEWDVQWR